MSIKPYFRSKNTYNIKLEVPAKLDKLEAPLPTLEVPINLLNLLNLLKKGVFVVIMEKDIL